MRLSIAAVLASIALISCNKRDQADAFNEANGTLEEVPVEATPADAAPVDDANAAVDANATADANASADANAADAATANAAETNAN